jgi:hypothetical protein
MLNSLVMATWFVPMFVVAALLALAVLAFEILMIVNAVNNASLSGTARAWWVVGMLLVHPFVAIAYYFTDYKKPRPSVQKS